MFVRIFFLSHAQESILVTIDQQRILCDGCNWYSYAILICVNVLSIIIISFFCCCCQHSFFFLFLSQFLVDCPLFLGSSAQQVARIVLGRSLWFGKERKETRESVNKKSKNQTTTHMIYDHNLYELKVPFDFVSLSLCFEYSDDEFLSIFVSLCLWKPRDRCNDKAQRMSLATSPKNACRL